MGTLLDRAVLRFMREAGWSKDQEARAQAVADRQKKRDADKKADKSDAAKAADNLKIVPLGWGKYGPTKGQPATHKWNSDTKTMDPVNRQSNVGQEKDPRINPSKGRDTVIPGPNPGSGVVEPGATLDGDPSEVPPEQAPQSAPTPPTKGELRNIEGFNVLPVREIVPRAMDVNVNRSLGMPGDAIPVKNPTTKGEIVGVMGRAAIKVAGSLIDGFVNIMNTSQKSPVVISNFFENVGAGTPTSQAGELAAVLFLATLGDDEAGRKLLEELVSKTDKKSGNNDSFLTQQWAKAGYNNSQACKRLLDETFGEGNWEMEAVAWDVREEVEQVIGMDYNQKEASTDAFLRIKAGGKSIPVQVSLKKDGAVNFLNLTTGGIPELVFMHIASESNRKKYQEILNQIEQLKGSTRSNDVQRRQKLQASAAQILHRTIKKEKIPLGILDSNARMRQMNFHEKVLDRQNKLFSQSLSKFSADPKGFMKLAEQTMAQKLSSSDLQSIQLVVNHARQTGELISMDMITSAIGSRNLRRVQKVSAMLMAGDPNLHSTYDKLRKVAFSHSEQVIDYLMNDKVGKKVINQAIREQMPIEGIMQGKEHMLIGEYHFSRNDAKLMFGTDDFSLVQERLRGTNEPPPPHIEYYVKGQEPIHVANIVSRPDGVGYGLSWKLEMKLSPDFYNRLKDVNQRHM